MNYIITIIITAILATISFISIAQDEQDKKAIMSEMEKKINQMDNNNSTQSSTNTDESNTASSSKPPLETNTDTTTKSTQSSDNLNNNNINTPDDTADSILEQVQEILNQKPDILKEFENNRTNQNISDKNSSVCGETSQNGNSSVCDQNNTSETNKKLKNSICNEQNIKNNIACICSKKNLNNTSICNEGKQNEASILLAMAKDKQKEAQNYLNSLKAKYQPIYDTIDIAKQTSDISIANKKLADKILNMNKDAQEISDKANENYEKAQNNLKTLSSDDINNWIKITKDEIQKAQSNLDKINSLISEIKKLVQNIGN